MIKGLQQKWSKFRKVTTTAMIIVIFCCGHMMPAVGMVYAEHSLKEAGMEVAAVGNMQQQNTISISTHAKAAALIDITSGRLLYSANGDSRMKIASLTKIMTAIVAIEHSNLSDQVKVTKQAVGAEGSSIYLKLGEQMSLHQLLYGLMLRSGNDAALAIAEHVGGSVEGFVYLMNETAGRLGLDNSHFMNPHGLDAELHYSTANDLAKLTAYALHNATFRDIVKTKIKQVADPGEQWNRIWSNKNKMLSIYEGADGVKTGYTKQALRCLVSSATRDGRQLAAVTLSDSDDWSDHRALLDYGFEQFPLRQIVTDGDTVAGTAFKAGGSFAYPLTEAERNGLSKRILYEQERTTEYRFGLRGKVQIYHDSTLIGAVPFYELASYSTSSAVQLDDKDKQSRTAKRTYGASVLAVVHAWVKGIRGRFDG